jgi:hypothetical protein
MDKKTSDFNRRPYIKPEIEKVQLLLDEAILSNNCKVGLDGVTGPLNTVEGCVFPGSATPCQDFAS